MHALAPCGHVSKRCPLRLLRPLRLLCCAAQVNKLDWLVWNIVFLFVLFLVRWLHLRQHTLSCTIFNMAACTDFTAAGRVQAQGGRLGGVSSAAGCRLEQQRVPESGRTQRQGVEGGMQRGRRKEGRGARAAGPAADHFRSGPA